MVGPGNKERLSSSMKGGVCLILSFGGGFQNVRVKDRRIKELERHHNKKFSKVYLKVCMYDIIAVHIL